MANTLKDIANLIAVKQSVLVDNLLEDAPILASIPYEQSSHPMWNVYADLESVTGGSFVNANEALPTMDSSSNLKQFSLGIIGGQHTVAKDTANMFGGAANYFASKEPQFLRKTGMTSETSIFNSMKQFALDNGSMLKTAATSGDGYTMMAVRYTSGETYGLYSPVGERTDGSIMTVTPLSNGGLYTLSSGVNGYGVEYRGYFGLQMASTRAVAGITNIQSSKIPTEQQIDQMLIEVRAKANNTVIYCDPLVLAYLKTYKTSRIQLVPSDTNVGTGIMTWDGIPFVTSYNIGASSFVTIS